MMREMRDVNLWQGQEIVRLRAALLFAKQEIEWWGAEHRCCAGHEEEAMQVIASALIVESAL